MLSIIGMALILVYYLYTSFFSTTHIARIINEHKEHYSIILSEDDKILIQINPEKCRPLASVVKLIVAIEFAEQVVAGKISNDELVALEALARYHAPNTDGNAHREWLSYLENNNKIIKEHYVPLWEIARGMIGFSSNANTEFLLDRLGLDNVNRRLEQLGFREHSKIKYLVSDMYIDEQLFTIKTDEEIYQQGKIIHDKLKAGFIHPDSFDYKHGLSLRKQKLLNDRMASATALEYHELLQKICGNNYFKPEVQTELSSIIERKVQPDKYDIIRMGAKGGSTIWVLNYVCYMERQNGKRYKLVLFSNYPSEKNNNFLITKLLGKFVNELTNDTKHAEKLIRIINQ